MDDKEQKFKTYRSLSDMHRFRLRLFAEGILTGIFAGIVISFFRFALSEMEYLRGALYNRLWVSDWSINACWFAVLIAIAFILHKLNCIEPMAAGSGIPQVKGAILGLMKMRWLHILWVKLTAGIIGIGNIMWVIVKERTQEIGIRRAIGAKPRDIIVQVLSEGMALTLIFGLGGICFAALVLGILQHLNNSPGEMTEARFQMAFTTALGILGLFVLLGTLAGLIPSIKAMKIKPVEAINER